MPIGMPELQQAFERSLGRPPRDDEAAFFLDQAQKNDLSAYEIGQILGGSPEAQRAQAPRDVQAFEQMAGKYDTALLGRAADTLEAKFRGQGRSASGSAYAAAYAATAQRLAESRQSQLSQIYQNRLAAASGQEAQMGQDITKRNYGLTDEKRQRAYALEDFYLQRDAFNDQLNQANSMRRRQAFGQLGGAALGAAAGGFFGGGTGAYQGAQIGSGLGGLFG